MKSFEELGLSPELTEALAAEGIERPTSLQEAAIPVLLRGNNILLAAAPGSGTLATWGSALLDRVEPEGHVPLALVLTPTAESAQRLGESLQRLAVVTGHTVAALGSPWAVPGRAHVLFGTPADVLAGSRSGDLDLSSVQAFVVDQADRIERLGGLHSIEDIVGFLPAEGQRIVCALPVTDGVADFVERHARRAPTVPARPSVGHAEGESPKRGVLSFRVVPEPKDEGLLATVAELLTEEVRHVLVYCRSEDRAADIGDYLTLHGYLAGAPGDGAAPVWLGVHELEARSAAEGAEGVVVVSADVPPDPDSMDRRHGLTGGGMVLAFPREMTHLRDIARRTGYSLKGSPLVRRANDEASHFRDLLASAIESEDAAPYMVLLEPLFERYDPAEVAAAAAALLRKKGSPSPGEGAPATSTPSRAPVTWVKLFLSVGERDGLTAKDLVGAITGEAGVPGGKVGKIDIRESHSVVEVQEAVAGKVISALNGTTIRGRSVRADFDRGRERGPSQRGRPPRRD
jgi:ATP-dependent RNA helicase DeaD